MTRSPVSAFGRYDGHVGEQQLADHAASAALLGAAGYGVEHPTPSFSSSGNTTTSSNTISGIPSTSQFAVGDPVSGIGIPDGATVSSVDSPTQIHISANATATGTSVALRVSPVLALTVNPSGCQTRSRGRPSRERPDTVMNTPGTRVQAARARRSTHHAFNPQGCAGPVISTTGNTTLNSLTVSAIPAGAVSGTGFSAGDAISGPGIPAGTTIAAVTSTTAITLSQPATATAPGVASRSRRSVGPVRPGDYLEPSDTTVQAPAARSSWRWRTAPSHRRCSGRSTKGGSTWRRHGRRREQLPRP